MSDTIGLPEGFELSPEIQPIEAKDLEFPFPRPAMGTGEVLQFGTSRWSFIALELIWKGFPDGRGHWIYRGTMMENGKLFSAGELDHITILKEKKG